MIHPSMIQSQFFDITKTIFAQAGWMPNQEHLSTESATRKLLVLTKIKCIYENAYVYNNSHKILKYLMC